ncbi:hypothetical protein LIZ07_24200, partial [Escherichia coli]|uniref:hypothetical protein n=1 Tax=Escherichia coli TaxID=562 RepID=UPI001D064B59
GSLSSQIKHSPGNPGRFKLTLRELIDTLAKDKNYKASKWDQRYREFTTLLQQTLTFAEPETDV